MRRVAPLLTILLSMAQRGLAHVDFSFFPGRRSLCLLWFVWIDLFPFVRSFVRFLPYPQILRRSVYGGAIHIPQPPLLPRCLPGFSFRPLVNPQLIAATQHTRVHAAGPDHTIRPNPPLSPLLPYLLSLQHATSLPTTHNMHRTQHEYTTPTPFPPINHYLATPADDADEEICSRCSITSSGRRGSSQKARTPALSATCKHSGVWLIVSGWGDVDGGMGLRDWSVGWLVERDTHTKTPPYTTHHPQTNPPRCSAGRRPPAPWRRA